MAKLNAAKAGKKKSSAKGAKIVAAAALFVAGAGAGGAYWASEQAAQAAEAYFKKAAEASAGYGKLTYEVKKGFAKTTATTQWENADKRISASGEWTMANDMELFLDKKAKISGVVKAKGKDIEFSGDIAVSAAAQADGTQTWQASLPAFKVKGESGVVEFGAGSASGEESADRLSGKFGAKWDSAVSKGKEGKDELKLSGLELAGDASVPAGELPKMNLTVSAAKAEGEGMSAEGLQFGFAAGKDKAGYGFKASAQAKQADFMGKKVNGFKLKFGVAGLNYDALKAFQALAEKAAKSPDGKPDAKSEAQALEALEKLALGGFEAGLEELAFASGPDSVSGGKAQVVLAKSEGREDFSLAKKLVLKAEAVFGGSWAQAAAQTAGAEPADKFSLAAKLSYGASEANGKPLAPELGQMVDGLILGWDKGLRAKFPWMAPEPAPAAEQNAAPAEVQEPQAGQEAGPAAR